MTIIDDRPTVNDASITRISAPASDEFSDDWDVESPATRRTSRTPARSAEAAAEADKDEKTQIIRPIALVITGLVGAAAAARSFTSLADLAARAEGQSELAYLWPGIVDGTILLATMSIVFLGSRRKSGHDRTFLWVVLATSALVSVGGNIIHAGLPQDKPLPFELKAAIAAVAPLSLLADVHIATILGRRAAPNATAASRTGRVTNANWDPKLDAIAGLVYDRNIDTEPIAELTVEEIGDILRRLNAGESQRSITRDTKLHGRYIRTIWKDGTEIRDLIDYGNRNTS
jgi:uncharacterized protein DUF2637